MCSFSQCVCIAHTARSSQERKRLYIVGYHSGGAAAKFFWPVPPKGRVLLSSILGAPAACPRRAKPRASQKQAKRNLRAILKRIRDKGVDPYKHCITIDVGAATPTWQFEKLGCLTASRCATGGHWVTFLGRKTSQHEILRAQGFNPDWIDETCITPRALGHAIGNAMTVPVIKAIFAKLLPAIGFAPLK